MRNAGNHAPAAAETINAAAAAIITAEARSRPTDAQRKRWGRCWSLYGCFGHHRTSKRIGHAVLVPELALPPPTAPITQPPSTASVVPFIAPPSSPSSFLQSDPPSIPQSPTKLLSLASLSAGQSNSPGGSAPVFSIGPYAYETQLVSPPVFSTFTTEPSTAAYTPPPESVQITTPSSPDVPFAQLVASSLEGARKNGVPYQFYYPGSPGLKSPGSGVTNSGTSSPFSDKRPVKVSGFESFFNRRWGSRLGSGSLTPDGAGLRSRLGSGSLTPCNETFPVDEQVIAEVGSAFNSDNGSRNGEDDALIVHHRVSFELTGEDVARCLESKSAAASFRALLEFPDNEAQEGSIGNQCLVSARSVKEFNFVNMGEDSVMRPEPGTWSEWWADGKASARDSKNRNSWSFFPFLGPQVG